MRPAAAPSGASAAMHVYLSHPAALADLRRFLERADCVVSERNAHHLEVEFDEAISASQARRELDVYLATWQATHPGIEAYVIEM
jgi:hypothetical protein